MRPLAHRAIVRVIAVLAVFASGFGAAHALERSAHGAGLPPATVYVPADGLAFRAADGRTIARLGYDANGGFFEVYDNGGGHHGGRDGSRPAMSLKNPYDFGF
jgi:hypothetical protein